jgi:microcin C transport system substrate-binding protein
LLLNADDEAFTEYGLIAKSIEMPEDRGQVTFNLYPEARWHDGKPLTADDVVWTFNTLMEKGHPFFKAYYANVAKAEAENKHRVTFKFNMTGNRELPLIMGQMPVLPKHYFEGKDFAATTLEPIVGSGPYKIKSVKDGSRITYERVKDWWAQDLPVMKGQYNFDEIIYDLFRDETVLLQALFSGNYDFRNENIAKAWNEEYDSQRAVKEGWVIKEEIPHSLPAGMQGFAFNIRRDMFKDPEVRRALNYAFDFEWSNKKFAGGKYKRTDSFFENSELAASGLPEGQELEILEPYRDQLPPEVFTTVYKNPETSGSGQDMRRNLAKAKDMLAEAGWTIGKTGRLEKDGKTFKFEILIQSDAFVRWISPMIDNLKRLGIEANVRVVDTAQYQNRMDTFDFDMTVATFGQSLSPGNEQRDFWGSEKADVNGARNIIGIKNPVVDALIDKIIVAPDRETLVATTRALDRVLLSGHYLIPHWYVGYHRVAYWNKFGHPATPPKYALGVLNTWWYDADKAAKLKSVTPDGKAAK